MPSKSPEPLLKVTLNLYYTDVIKAKTRFGRGYQERLRDLIHEALKDHRPTRTLADFATHEDLDAE